MPADRMPLVSVIIPTYNRPDYLGESLASAIGQSYRNLEIIIHDNASDADLAPIVERLADPRVTLFRNERNLGITGNVAAALERVSGKYVAILGDDDVWQPNFIARLVAPMEANDDVVVSFCDHDIIDGQGRPNLPLSDALTKRFGRHRLREGIYQPFEEIALLYRSICMLSGAVLRLQVFDDADFPSELVMGLDVYLCYLAARTGKSCYYTPERLSHYRYHGRSLTSALEDSDTRISNASSALFYWNECLHDSRLRRHRHYFEVKRGLNALVIVTSLLRRGDRRKALAELRRFLHDGVLHPRLVFYHIVYAVRLHRATA